MKFGGGSSVSTGGCHYLSKMTSRDADDNIALKLPASRSVCERVQLKKRLLRGSSVPPWHNSSQEAEDLFEQISMCDTGLRPLTLQGQTELRLDPLIAL